jgi:hypothetical protein
MMTTDIRSARPSAQLLVLYTASLRLECDVTAETMTLFDAVTGERMLILPTLNVMQPEVVGEDGPLRCVTASQPYLRRLRQQSPHP